MPPLLLEDRQVRWHREVGTRAKTYFLTTEALGTTRFEIVATSVTFQQENLSTPINLSFRIIQRLQTEKGITLSYSFYNNPIVLWREYLIGSFGAQASGAQARTRGLFLWSMTDNSILYFEVCHSSFPFPGALNPDSRQMGGFPHCMKVLDDLLFTNFDISDGAHKNTAYRCIHLPSLVPSTQPPGGSPSLAENAFDVILPKCIKDPRAAMLSFSVHSKIYSIPASTPTHPRYCFINKRFLAPSQGVEWEVLEVEIDLSIPGPIKKLSRVGRQYNIQCPSFVVHDIDDDLLLYLPLGRADQARASFSIQFLQVGEPGNERLAKLERVDEMRLTELCVDRDAGYVILLATDYRSQLGHYCSFIWWLDERKAGTKELISSWSRDLLWPV